MNRRGTHPRLRPEPSSTPICRCRVLYLGSAVPHITKDSLQGIQEPLGELYPEQGAFGVRGIDSWLSVWSNGLLLENVDENGKKVTRFFPIDSLHYCAAVRYVLVPERNSGHPRFLPLDSPFARLPNPAHPPLFAAILRRTSGIKVLECHAFICKRELAANALVRCCFHAYADSSYARQMETGISGGGSVSGVISNTINKVDGWRLKNSPLSGSTGSVSTLTLNGGAGGVASRENGYAATDVELMDSADESSIYNLADDNRKVWISNSKDYSLCGDVAEGGTICSAKSNRPRQSMNFPPPPPPPVKDEKTLKERNHRKKMSEGSSNRVLRDDIYGTTYGSSVSMVNGSASRGGNGMRYSASPCDGLYYKGPRGNIGGPSQLLNGSYIGPLRSTNGSPAQQSHGSYYPMSHPKQPRMLMVPTTLPHPPRRHSSGNYMTSAKGTMVPVPRLPPPNLINNVPMGTQPLYIQTGRKKSKNNEVLAMEESIYMPSARPLSPVASYQPGHHHHEVYLTQRHAQPSKKKGKSVKSSKKNSPIGSIPNGISGNGTAVMNGTARINGGTDEDTEENESIYNTDVYKRTGHLNEREFSRSIRQEHRICSYGSLAKLKFVPSPVVPNDAVLVAPYPINREDIKKEREIMQMIRDLDLSGNEIRKMEVPPGMYQPNIKGNAKASK